MIDLFIFWRLCLAKSLVVVKIHRHREIGPLNFRSDLPISINWTNWTDWFDRWIQQAFEVAGTRRTTPFATAADKAAAAAADAEGDESPLGSFTCLRIDGSVTTPVR